MMIIGLVLIEITCAVILMRVVLGPDDREPFM